MTKNEERDLFLKKLANIYAQNPDLQINNATIYNMLYTFNVHNGKDEKLSKISLLNVQLSLNEKYKNDARVNTFTFGNGYFWAIENRNGLSDEEYFKKMENAIKLYIPTNSQHVNYIAENLFDFMIKEGIINQSKIAKEFRNDALVIRVSNREEAEKVIKFYHETMAYNVKVKPNPFVPADGKVGIAMDGRLSFNSTIAKFLVNYFKEKRQNDSFDKVDEKDFLEFLNKIRSSFKNGNNQEMIAGYGLDSPKKMLDFMIIGNILSSNISGTLNTKSISNYQKVEDEIQDFDIGAKRINLLYIMNNLNNKYGYEEMHERINRYIENGDIKLFTRENGVRQMVMENFTPDTMKSLLSEMSYSALIDASFETTKKYNNEQLGYAIEKLLKEHKIDGFTNTNDVRSYLGFISNNRIMMNMLSERMEERGQELNPENVMRMILEEIERRKNNEKGPVR